MKNYFAVLAVLDQISYHLLHIEKETLILGKR